MSSTRPDIDRLAETASAMLPRRGQPGEHTEAAHAALDELVALARGSALLREEGDMLLRNVRRWEKRAEAAEARVAELEADNQVLRDKLASWEEAELAEDGRA